MKIIKKGKTKEQDCEKCGCKFEYEGKDVKTYTSGVFVKDVLEPEYGLKCPSCKIKIVVGRF